MSRPTPTDTVPTWDQVVDDHSARVFRLAYRLTGNRADAEDLTQEVFVRVFRSLEIGRSVYYLQETLPHNGVDVRAFVIGDRVVGAIERVGSGWRANLARGAEPRPITLDEARARMCVQAAATLGTDYAGVDLLRAADGRDYVIEVNGIPGWRGVESATGVDVAAALVEHLERR